MHRIWSNKNIVCSKVTWFLPMKKGCLGGIPKLWCLYLLDISCGDMGIPKLELLSILHFISSLSISYTWKLPSYKTSHNSISNVSINIIVNQPFWFRFHLKHTTYKAYTTVATSSKVPWSKELKKKAIERQTQIVAEICQNSWQRSIFLRTFCCSNQKVQNKWKFVYSLGHMHKKYQIKI
jgi:hypothetical protein